MYALSMGAMEFSIIHVKNKGEYKMSGPYDTFQLLDYSKFLILHRIIKDQVLYFRNRMRKQDYHLTMSAIQRFNYEKSVS